MEKPNTEHNITVGIDVPKSKQMINADLKKLLSELDDLKIKINHVDIPEISGKISSIKLKAPDPDTAKTKSEIKALTRQLIDFKNEYASLLENMNESLSAGQWSKLQAVIDSMNAPSRQADQKNTEFSFNKWADSVSIEDILTYIEEMYQEMCDIHDAMEELYKITDQTDERYQAFLKTSIENSKELGRSISSLIAQSAQWAGQGFSLDQSEALAKIGSVYANTADISDAAAVTDLAAAMEAFRIRASDAMTVIDPLNKLGKEFAVSSGDLGDGLQKSASAMAAAGADMHQTLAMLAGGAEITQNAGEFGDFLKIGAMRIRGMKDELEAMGEEADLSADSVQKIQSQILRLTYGNVDIFDNPDQLKSYYKIMEEISDVYGTLSSKRQAALSDLLFGSQNQKQGDALIRSFQSGQVQKAYEAAASSSGSAYKAQEDWMNSMQAKTTQFQAAFQSLSNTIFSDNLPKFFTDLGTAGVSALDNLIEKFGALNTLATIGGGFLGAKNLGQQNKTDAKLCGAQYIPRGEVEILV